MPFKNLWQCKYLRKYRYIHNETCPYNNIEKKSLVESPLNFSILRAWILQNILNTVTFYVLARFCFALQLLVIKLRTLGILSNCYTNIPTPKMLILNEIIKYLSNDFQMLKHSVVLSPVPSYLVYNVFPSLKFRIII